MSDRRLLGLSAVLLGGGIIFFLVVSFFHPGGVDSNKPPRRVRGIRQELGLDDGPSR
jgi:hypothetical protein